MQETKYKTHRWSGQTPWNVTIFCGRSNCGNANLSGVKPQGGPVEQTQGSKGVCCNSGGLYSNSEASACRRAETLGPGPETLFRWPVSSLKSNRTRVVDRLQSAGFWEHRPGEPAERTETHTDSRVRSGHWAVGLHGLVSAVNFLSLSLSPSLSPSLPDRLTQNSRASCTNSDPVEWAFMVVWLGWKCRMC